jgi:hypothetical protein
VARPIPELAPVTSATVPAKIVLNSHRSSCVQSVVCLPGVCLRRDARSRPDLIQALQGGVVQRDFEGALGGTELLHRARADDRGRDSRLLQQPRQRQMPWYRRAGIISRSRAALEPELTAIRKGAVREDRVSCAWVVIGMATPVPSRGRVGRVSRSFDCQLEIVPVDLDLT